MPNIGENYDFALKNIYLFLAKMLNRTNLNSGIFLFYFFVLLSGDFYPNACFFQNKYKLSDFFRPRIRYKGMFRMNRTRLHSK